MKFYTGLPNSKILKAVFNLIEPALAHHKHCKLTPYQEFIMVLMKLRLNSQMQDLAYRFGVSFSNCIQNIFKMDKHYESQVMSSYTMVAAVTPMD